VKCMIQKCILPHLLLPILPDTPIGYFLRKVGYFQLIPFSSVFEDDPRNSPL